MADQLTDIDGNPRELEPGEKPLELSAGCKDFVEVNKACDSEIEQFCQGMYYHGDTMTCLTQWTSPSDLSSSCTAALPKQAGEGLDRVTWDYIGVISGLYRGIYRDLGKGRRQRLKLKLSV
ncbi:unnamed protein product [Symbiodinium pilosum]|uniref:Uncharacterized protein n=1 Tax=Symbiodinium pilosum TaxID=2952 RepID=A0A812X3E8_SYMPI|nr:unnamed protein product [Symbiodinium pilosum]